MKVIEKAHYKIAISGAADTSHCGPHINALAEELGREVIRQRGVVITGATTGAPYWAAKGAKGEGGLSIGFSPAVSEREHVKVYKLPTDYFDVIVYTGFDYSGRNLILMRASDAVIIACGRIGTINEFTVAFEDKKPIGVLLGPFATDELIKEMVKEAHRGPGKIVYEADPKELVKKVIELIEIERNKN